MKFFTIQQAADFMERASQAAEEVQAGEREAWPASIYTIAPRGRRK